MNQAFTFRKRVEEFWDWFPTVAESLAETIKGGDSEKTRSLLGEKFAGDVQEKIGHLSWVFGPGKEKGRLSFTVTGEGQVARQLLSHYWLSQAVDVPGWDFYCARQPSPLGQLSELEIDVAGNSVDANSLMVATDVDEENESVNITAWHNAFENVEAMGRFQILYLLLDEALGEYGTQTKLGSIEFQKDDQAKPLCELPDFLDKLWSEKGWAELSPIETYSGYQVEPSEGFARADTIAGYTCVPNVVIEFLNNRGFLEENPVEDSGAEFVFVQIQRDPESLADPLEFRTAIENEMTSRLDGGGGYVVGGATGVYHSYIDVVILDGEHSLAAIGNAMAELQLNGKYEIKRFVT